MKLKEEIMNDLPERPKRKAKPKKKRMGGAEDTTGRTLHSSKLWYEFTASLAIALDKPEEANMNKMAKRFKRLNSSGEHIDENLLERARDLKDLELQERGARLDREEREERAKQEWKQERYNYYTSYLYGYAGGDLPNDGVKNTLSYTLGVNDKDSSPLKTFQELLNKLEEMMQLDD